ncbi:MAG: hypothetical protein C5B59_03560 [Bacteroidetes bacterium]|nr:MAG: hypothetical protein C5B59_03560 [Bacteroidota bacterium]
MNVKIPVNKKRFPHSLIISIVLTIIGAFFIKGLLKSDSENAGYLSYWILAIPLYYFFLSFPDYLKTVFDRNAALTISDTDIKVNLSIFSCGRIDRDDVRDVQVIKRHNNEFLVIKLFNNNKYLSASTSFKSPTQNSFIKKFGSPVVISQKHVNYDLHTIKDIILDGKNNDINKDYQIRHYKVSRSFRP